MQFHFVIIFQNNTFLPYSIHEAHGIALSKLRQIMGEILISRAFTAAYYKLKSIKMIVNIRHEPQCFIRRCE